MSNLKEIVYVFVGCTKEAFLTRCAANGMNGKSYWDVYANKAVDICMKNLQEFAHEKNKDVQDKQGLFAQCALNAANELFNQIGS
jgi:hypothetical protein